MITKKNDLAVFGDLERGLKLSGVAAEAAAKNLKDFNDAADWAERTMARMYNRLKRHGSSFQLPIER